MQRPCSYPYGVADASVRKTALGLYLTLSAMLLCACDAAEYPEGFYGVQGISFSRATQQPPPNDLITVFADIDNPQPIAHIAARPGISVTWFDQANVACNPVLTPAEDPINNYTHCQQSFHLSSTPGDDRLVLRAIGQEGFVPPPFFAGMFHNRAIRSGLYTPQYRNDGFPGLYFTGCPGPTYDCQGVTFPLLFPTIHLPLNRNGQVDQTWVRLTLIENSRATAISQLIRISPTLGERPLIVVPVHVHHFRDGDTDEIQSRIANDLVRTFDDPGSVRAGFGSENEAELTRSISEQPERRTTERLFAECGVQLRLVSVEFHRRDAELLEDGRINAHCGACRQSDCPFFVNTPLGSRLQSFARNVASTRQPQGIHVAIINGFAMGDVRTGNPDDILGSGYGCATEPNVPPMAISQLDSDGKLEGVLHEIMHTLTWTIR